MPVRSAPPEEPAISTGRPARYDVRWLVLLAALVVAAIAFLGSATSASAAEPPNQNDPCARGGRNICGTTGVGSYERYRYGLRWFGDFRGAVPGAAQTFCVDLRFWYPSKALKYKEIANEGFRNRAGAVVSMEKQRRMAYAMWNYGRSNSRNRQAAVMLYVHSLMGDGAPGEVDPTALGPGVTALFNRISRESARFRGPYRIDVKIPGGLRVGTRAQGTVRVLSASGAALPNVSISLTFKGASGPARVRTNARGVATIAFTPSGAGGVSVEARSQPIASTLPRLFAPSTPVGARNGQRLAGPASQRVSATVAQVSQRATVSVTTQAFPNKVLVGQANRDKVTITGLPPGRRTRITSLLHGPFRNQAEIRCDGQPAVRSTFDANGSGTYSTPVARLSKPGFYTYQVVIPGDRNLTAVTTPCGVPAETFRVEVQPQVTTKISNQRTAPGDTITDTVIVSGLNGESATVNAALFGPFPTRAQIRCDVAPFWSGTVQATGDGEYLTEPVELTSAGYYTYRETIDANGFVRAGQTACGDLAETTIAVAKPTIRTQISSQQSKPGDTITDQVIVSGLGAVAAEVRVELWGPYPTREAINCTGTPYWTGAFPAVGDGTYTTAPVTIDRAGYYTYRESIAPGEGTEGVQTACGDVAETTLSVAQPTVTTLVSSEVTRPGAQIYDRIRVRGLGRTPAEIQVELFGPFATRAAIRCNGTPFWRGTVSVTGDGTVNSERVTVPRAGFYTYRERIVGTPTVTGTQTECGLVEETALAAPTINTGRAEPTPGYRELQVPAALPRPTRVRIADLAINAPVGAVGINIPAGTLNVPPNIHRLGWWRDGAAPGSATGSILVAGHIDSARAGPGAFFRLRNARPGMRVQVTSADGRNRQYRVTAVRRVLKNALPASIYSLKGRNRLVLVSCGGPFDQASGHYKDNIVVTALPVGR